MTKKDFELIAQRIRDFGWPSPPGRILRNEFIEFMADALATTNPRFDRQRFVNAARGDN